MTQLSNTPMQPKPTDAVERLTLVEKLEKVIAGHNAEFNKIIRDATDHQKIAHTAVLAGLLSAIKVVKQHSEWISVDERLPPDNMMVLVYCHIRKATGYAFVSNQQAWSFYHFTKNSENQAWAMANDISKWMPIPQPPSEVQDD